MRMPSRIAFFGVTTAGKNTLAANIRNDFGYTETAFAALLKEVCQKIFGFSEEDLYGPSSNRERPYKRFRFTGWCFECNTQAFGPERFLPDPEDGFPVERAGKDLEDLYADAPNYFECPSCNAPFRKYVNAREALKTLGTAWGRKFCEHIWIEACLQRAHEGPTLITDGRFLDEFKACREDGVLTVLLLRGLEESRNPHPSEAEVRELAKHPERFDLVLDNRLGDARLNYYRFLRQVELLLKGDELRKKVDLQGPLFHAL